LVLVAGPRGLVGARFVDQGLPDAWQGLPSGASHAALQTACAWIQAYSQSAHNTPKDRPTYDEGAATPFQRRVWQALDDLPAGHTISYGTLAERLGSSPRAVGRAVGQNPWLLLRPCHRVVGAQGALTGYAAGIERKRALLLFEAAR
jgi:methylated-DNA-[protein]-cysteine S-methyltransferase